MLQNCVRLSVMQFRRYHRSSDSQWTRFWNEKWNPVRPDGSWNHFHMNKIAAVIVLINLTSYRIYEELCKFNAGEETVADRWWRDSGGRVDLGFRSTTREDEVEKKN